MLNKLRVRRNGYEEQILENEARIKKIKTENEALRGKIAILDEIIAEEQSDAPSCVPVVEAEKPSEETIVLLCHGAKENSEA